MTLLNSLIIGYVVLYAVGWTALLFVHSRLVPAAEKASDPWWDTPLDVLVASVSLCGMLLLVFRVEYAPLQMLWRPLSIIIIVEEVWRNWTQRRQLLSEQAGQVSQPAVRSADIGGAVLLAPALLLNLAYAFGM